MLFIRVDLFMFLHLHRDRIIRIIVLAIIWVFGLPSITIVTFYCVFIMGEALHCMLVPLITAIYANLPLYFFYIFIEHLLSFSSTYQFFLIIPASNT